MQNYLLLFVAGFSSVFAVSPYNHYIFTFFSLCILLNFLEQLPQKHNKSYLLAHGYVYASAYFLSQLYWIFYCVDKVIAAGFVIALIVMLLVTVYLASFIVFAIYLYSRLKIKSNTAFNLILLLPSLWTLSEYLRGRLFSGFPWCDIGYTQVNNSLILGLYPIFGSYSVSWFCLSISGVIVLIVRECFYSNHALSFTLKLNRKKLALLLLIITVFCSIIYSNSITYTKLTNKKVKFALLQGNIVENLKWYSDDALTVYTRLVAEAKADIVIIPETGIARFFFQLPPKFLPNLIALANKNQAALLVGMPMIIDHDANYVNAAILLTAPNMPYYAKRHLVPYGEYIPWRKLLVIFYQAIALPMVNFSSGAQEQLPLNIAGKKLAINICYENGFNSELIADARIANIMVNLSDMMWYGNTIAKNEHLQISQARALENQRYFVQATNDGLTAVIDNKGNVVKILPKATMGVLYADVDSYVGVTPFERYGNYPLIIFCLIIVALAYLFRYRNTMCLIIDEV